ncbi:hypothetical protein PYW07_010822 [Mythimna separata]|uniref:Protein cueball n=1 Tax=Mythimna separata TaxID=271217 RepID=A0AAD7Y7T9_MYTSE|nr:hypothetical protein PYW07_010822 [Mythimna separata]
MFRTQCVLGLVALCVGLAHPWDLAVTHSDRLEFYVNNTKTDTVNFDSHKLTALTYDEVHDMLLYVDKQNNNDTICGYGITSKVNQCFMERKGRNIRGIAFDPATELLFFSDTNERSINWISVKSGSNEYGNLITKIDDGIPTDVAVDSCKGYVYWIITNLTVPRIERALFDGSEKKVVLSISKTDNRDPHSLVIDQQTKRIYWIEPVIKDNIPIYGLYYTDLNGKDKTKIYYLYEFSSGVNPISTLNTLTVSKGGLFWIDWRLTVDISVWLLGKIVWSGNLAQIGLHTKYDNIGIAANYKIKDQIEGINDCEALTFVGPKKCKEPFCVHGVKVGLSLCKCRPGYIGERCDVSVCENDYCLNGNCSVNDQGTPTCRCNTGFSGERCEVTACHNYCLNNGVCSLNEEDEPSCECVDNYEGSRCETSNSVTLTFSNTAAYSEETNKTLIDLLSNWRKPKILVITDES